MSTLDAFNTLMRNFITELNETFPEFKELAVFAMGYDAFVSLDPSKPLETFMETMEPHSSLIMGRDVSLFEQEGLALGGAIDLKQMWHSQDLSEATRDAIWQYLTTLYVLGSTIKSMSPEVLGTIESVAHDCANKVESGEMSMADIMPSLMQSMSSILGNLK
jgi:hypothetical protein